MPTLDEKKEIFARWQCAKLPMATLVQLHWNFKLYTFLDGTVLNDSEPTVLILVCAYMLNSSGHIGPLIQILWYKCN